MAAGAANNGRAPPIILKSNGQREKATSDQSASMDGLATYVNPGSPAEAADPFAESDLWPQ